MLLRKRNVLVETAVRTRLPALAERECGILDEIADAFAELNRQSQSSPQGDAVRTVSDVAPKGTDADFDEREATEEPRHEAHG